MAFSLGIGAPSGFPTTNEVRSARWRPTREPAKSLEYVEKLIVDYYGSEVPLQQLAGFALDAGEIGGVDEFDTGHDVLLQKQAVEGVRPIHPLK